MSEEEMTSGGAVLDHSIQYVVPDRTVRKVVLGDAVLDYAADDVDLTEIADLVAVVSNTCTPHSSTVDFLEEHVLPILGPALRATLVEIRRDRCVERAYSRLNALDHLAGQLYRLNPRYPERAESDIFATEMAQQQLEQQPRRPLPLCLRLSDDAAAVVVQKCYRGYLVRRRQDVSRLRQYQANLRRLSQQPGAPTGPAPVPPRSDHPCR